jgi:hypothetical protein
MAVEPGTRSYGEKLRLRLFSMRGKVRNLVEQIQSELSPFVMSAGGSVLDGDEYSAFPNSPDPLKAAWNLKVVN